MTIQTYTVQAHCSNCDFNGLLNLPFGTPAPTIGGPAVCPNCGCKTARKAEKKVELDYISKRWPMTEKTWLTIDPLPVKEVKQPIKCADLPPPSNVTISQRKLPEWVKPPKHDSRDDGYNAANDLSWLFSILG